MDGDDGPTTDVESEQAPPGGTSKQEPPGGTSKQESNDASEHSSDGMGTTRAASERDGHDRLASLLSEADMAVPTQVHQIEEVFETDGEAAPLDVFPQSVSSGGPTPSGVILWTRVDPDAYDPESDLGVRVAEDPDFENVVYRAVVDDTDAVRAHDHTVSVDLDGALEADSTYHYEFVHDGVASPTGRCRTLPAPDAEPEELSFAVLACQNYQAGYYGAYHHVAEADVDFVVHVGDFIYESGAECFKGLGSPDLPDRELELPSGYTRVETLADYRYLYRTYRADPLMQEAMEEHTLIAAWDDHEIANDVYWNDDLDAPQADHPRGDDPEYMLQLTADALHAWWEYMPARIGYDPDAEHLQDRFRIYRTFQFGDLVDLVFTDERLFRDGPRDHWLPTERATHPENEPDDRTILGDEQREWLLDQVGNGGATWTVWADEVLTIPLKFGSGRATVYPVQVGWDGFRGERRQVMDGLAERGVENLVTITGDMHSYLAGYQQTEYDGGLFGSGADPETRVGVEFMTPSVCSINVAEALGVDTGLRARLTEPIVERFVLANNPHLEYFDSHHWGYSVVEFTPDDCTYLAYSVDKTVNGPEAERDLIKALRVPDGDVRIEDVTDEYR